MGVWSGSVPESSGRALFGSWPICGRGDRAQRVDERLCVEPAVRINSHAGYLRWPGDNAVQIDSVCVEGVVQFEPTLEAWGAVVEVGDDVCGVGRADVAESMDGAVDVGPHLVLLEYTQIECSRSERPDVGQEGDRCLRVHRCVHDGTQYRPRGRRFPPGARLATAGTELVNSGNA
jgi:hypothetical protein